MKKQAALLLSTLVLLSAVSMQPAQALKLWHKKAKPAVVAPEVKKEAAKPAPAVKPAPVAPAKPAVKPAVAPAAKPVQKAAPKAPVKK